MSRRSLLAKIFAMTYKTNLYHCRSCDLKEKVAFLITVYKEDKIDFFKQAVESIVDQDYGFEFINIYLGIDGKLSNEVKGYIHSNDRLFYKIIKNRRNEGLGPTLNKLIEALCDERFVFRMDSDDISKPNRVSKQVRFMIENPGIEIIGGAIEEIDEKYTVKMIRTYPKTTKAAKDFISKASIFAHPTVCFNRSVFSKGFRYNQKLRFNQDIALWYDILYHKIQISNLDDVVLSLRVTSDFYRRRSYKRALSEFAVYCRGIKLLYGSSWRYIFPVIRLVSRLMPVFIIETLYSERIRRILNK